ncbi:hypothetical protein PTSG_08821 [Salpingoeca rosetta]|uniref:Sulfotransferase domain-containing protein n=1 Tax=Salpingoeca rosetta (strain ATCC 50818 / BSB-021) TaxID=946362 RepID=F2UKT1_SALR5|nr:uncharacterized protein PTSG_08821 [Salpingoeca rosetta]EGD77730.1 hypothetical protein PTSG_08821 [Salpingoeca rosetta]|eukprot:XP_004990206.1 hypothetical protein PTSG_08821 [Salpingoeca rosetta]
MVVVFVLALVVMVVVGLMVEDVDGVPLSLSQNNQLVFVIGVQYEAIMHVMDILGQHPEVSLLSGTGKPKNDAQHLQNVFKTAHELGGMLSFSFHDEAHMTEKSELFTDDSRLALLGSWRDHWDLDKPLLALQSPRFATMTRYLQALFGEDNTKFVVVLQHPLHAWRPALNMYWQQAALSCGKPFVQQWVHIHQTLEEDMAHLKHVHVVRYEDLVPASHVPTPDNQLHQYNREPAFKFRGAGAGWRQGQGLMQAPRFTSLAQQQRQQQQVLNSLFHFLRVSRPVALWTSFQDSAILNHR